MGRLHCVAQCLTAIVLLTVSVTALAQPQTNSLIETSQYLEDPRGDFSPETLGERAFTEFEGMLARGYTPSTYWIKLAVSDSAKSQEQLVLRIRPTYLDDIQLYLPDPNDSGRLKLIDRSGDLHPWSEDEYRSLNFNFLLSGEQLADTIYLRVSTSSSVLVYPQLLTIEQALGKDRALDIFGGLLIGALTMIMLWGIVQWAADRERVMTAFILKQAAVLTHAMGYMGYWRVWFSEHVSPQLLNEIYAINIYLMTVSAIWFLYLFLKEYRPNPLGLKVMVAFVWLLPVQLLLQVLGHMQIAVHIVSMQALVMPVLTTFLAFTARVWNDPDANQDVVLSRPALITFFLLLFAVLWIYVLPVLGLFTFSPLTLYGILFYNLITSLMMFSVLQVRARYRMQNVIHQAEQSQFYEQEALRERERGEQNARFLSMLAHELKTPLATIRMLTNDSWEHSGAVRTAVQDMDEVIERCIATGRLEEQRITLNNTRYDVHNVIRQSLDRLGDEAERIKVAPPESPIHANGDAYLVKVILDNLLGNACRYADKRTPIQCRVITDEIPQQRLGIEVTNVIGRRGAPDPEQIFDKYYRAPAARHATGSGLGLYLSQGLAKLMNGRIDCALEPSDTPVQIRMTLWLPV